MDKDKAKVAFAVLTKARNEIINEMAACGNYGGAGKVSAYAPSLFYIMGSMDAIEPFLADVEMTEDQKRMAAVRAARTK